MTISPIPIVVMDMIENCAQIYTVAKFEEEISLTWTTIARIGSAANQVKYTLLAVAVALFIHMLVVRVVYSSRPSPTNG